MQAVTTIPGLNFTAIDFETANQHAASVCAVGLIKVRDGAVVETVSSLVRNPDGGPFNRFNTRVHGITAADVAGSPDWRDLWPGVLSFVGADALLAHNAGFDRRVWYAACEASQIRAHEVPFYCTLRLARRVLGLPSNRLPLVVEALGLPVFSHHDATADALACAQVGIELASREGYASVEEFDTQVGVRSRKSPARR